MAVPPLLWLRWAHSPGRDSQQIAMLGTSVIACQAAVGNVFGRNRAYVEEHLPHVAELVGGTLPAQVVGESAVVVIGKRVEGIDERPRLVDGRRTVIDLAGVPGLGDVSKPWSSERQSPESAAAGPPE